MTITYHESIEIRFFRGIQDKSKNLRDYWSLIKDLLN